MSICPPLDQAARQGLQAAVLGRVRVVVSFVGFFLGMAVSSFILSFCFLAIEFAAGLDEFDAILSSAVFWATFHSQWPYDAPLAATFAAASYFFGRTGSSDKAFGVLIRAGLSGCVVFLVLWSAGCGP